MEPDVIRIGDMFIGKMQPTRMDIPKLNVERCEKRVLSGLRGTLLRYWPIIPVRLIGQSEKGGFVRSQELFNCHYPNGVPLLPADAHKAQLLPFSWDKDEWFLCHKKIQAHSRV